jgi:hypothetical protein
VSGGQGKADIWLINAEDEYHEDLRGDGERRATA